MIWGLSIAVFIVVTGIVVSRYGRNTCKSVQITINAPEDGAFLTEDDIRYCLSGTADSLSGKALDNINVEAVESLINNNPFVLSSKVYLSLSGVLRIEVTQRTPIARVQPDTLFRRIKNVDCNPYFISSDGHMMPLADGKAIRVVVANGKIRTLYSESVNLNVDSTQMAKDSTGPYTTLYNIFHVADYISKSPFLKAQIQQIYVEGNGDLDLIPEVGEHVILFGDGNNIAEKFRRLEVFYEKATFFKGWDIYDTINVKYKNQIICSKKS